MTGRAILAAVLAAGHERWWLLSLSDDGAARVIRAVDDGEYSELSAAAQVARAYDDEAAMDLFARAHLNVQRTLNELTPGLPLDPGHTRDQKLKVVSALVPWTQAWGVLLDQTARLLSSRRTGDDQHKQRWEQATHDAFDTHSGYRLACGLRNVVAHQQMPPLRFAGSVRTTDGRRDEEVRVELRGDILLQNAHLGRLVRDDLANGTAPLDVREFVADAMAGMRLVIDAYLTEVGPQVQSAWAAIESLAAETAPDRTVLARLAEDLSLSAASFDDLMVSSVLRATVPPVAERR